jgi:NADH:ubiquinone oxidoreductase subunit C
MNEEIQQAITALEERFSIEAEEFRGEINLIVAGEEVVAVCQMLRDDFDFKFMEVMTAVDYWP